MNRIAALFEGHPTLVYNFEHFLPPGWSFVPTTKIQGADQNATTTAIVYRAQYTGPPVATTPAPQEAMQQVTPPPTPPTRRLHLTTSGGTGGK